jgi:hypothetical protein
MSQDTKSKVVKTKWQERLSPEQSHVHGVIFICVILGLVSLVPAQAPSTTSAALQESVKADYPKDRAGILIQKLDWVTIEASMPTKTKAKRGLAASLSYGAVPANVVAEYAGLHAQVQIEPGQPVICICHLISLPGDPALVKLHPKKESRELDGGRMTVLPIVGGSKTADANKSDLIAVDLSHPESTVWLVRPQQALPPGEYALMLGTQNVSIFPFTVSSPDSVTQTSKP